MKNRDGGEGVGNVTMVQQQDIKGGWEWEIRQHTILMDRCNRHDDNEES
jgi:hypothetical protein